MPVKAGVPKGKQKPFRGVPKGKQSSYYRRGLTPPAQYVTYTKPMQFGTTLGGYAADPEPEISQAKTLVISKQPKTYTVRAASVGPVSPTVSQSEPVVQQPKTVVLPDKRVTRELSRRFNVPQSQVERDYLRAKEAEVSRVTTQGAEYVVPEEYRSGYERALSIEKAKARNLAPGQLSMERLNKTLTYLSAREANVSASQPVFSEERQTPQFSLEDWSKSIVQGGYWGGGIGLVLTAPYGGVGAVPGAIGGGVGGGIAYPVTIAAETWLPEKSPLPSTADMTKTVYGGSDPYAKYPGAGPYAAKMAVYDVGRKLGGREEEWPFGIRTSDVWGSLAFIGGGYAAEKVAVSAVPKLTTYRVMPSAVGVKEPSGKVVWRGIAWEGEGETRILFGRTKGLEYRVGEPKKLKIDLSQYPTYSPKNKGYSPRTYTEGYLIRKYGEFPKVERIKQVEINKLMVETKDVPSAFVQKKFIEETKTLSPEGVREVLGAAKKERATVYGSFAQRSQMPEELVDDVVYRVRVPADIDIQLPTDSAARAEKFTERLTAKLASKGERVQISPKSKTLIEAQGIDGEWHHAVDIHFKDMPSASQSGVGDMAWGYNLNRGAIKISGVKTQKLGEQGVRKGVSITQIWRDRFAPEAHRMKDVGDFINIQKVLLASKGKPTTFTKELEAIWAKQGVNVAPRPVSVELYSPPVGGSMPSPSVGVGGVGRLVSASLGRSAKKSASYPSNALSKAMGYYSPPKISKALSGGYVSRSISPPSLKLTYQSISPPPQSIKLPSLGYSKSISPPSKGYYHPTSKYYPKPSGFPSISYSRSSPPFGLRPPPPSAPGMLPPITGGFKPKEPKGRDWFGLWRRGVRKKEVGEEDYLAILRGRKRRRSKWWRGSVFRGFKL